MSGSGPLQRSGRSADSVSRVVELSDGEEKKKAAGSFDPAAFRVLCSRSYPAYTGGSPRTPEGRKSHVVAGLFIVLCRLFVRLLLMLLKLLIVLTAVLLVSVRVLVTSEVHGRPQTPATGAAASAPIDATA